MLPKFAPAMVIELPIGPEEGVRLVMLGGGGVTVKGTALLAMLFTVATTLPVVAPAGTGRTMLVALHEEGVPVVPLNFTVLVPCEAPKFEPLMVTGVPITPEVGFMLVMLGGVTPPTFGLKAARAAPQTSEAPRVAVAEAEPATT